MSEATFTRWVDPTIEEKDKEIERLNNIINELEKDIDLELYKTRANDEYNEGLFNAFRYVKDKLEELKGAAIELDVLKALNEDSEDDVPMG